MFPLSGRFLYPLNPPLLTSLLSLFSSFVIVLPLLLCSQSQLLVFLFLRSLFYLVSLSLYTCIQKFSLFLYSSYNPLLLTLSILYSLHFSMYTCQKPSFCPPLSAPKSTFHIRTTKPLATLQQTPSHRQAHVIAKWIIDFANPSIAMIIIFCTSVFPINILREYLHFSTWCIFPPIALMFSVSLIFIKFGSPIYFHPLFLHTTSNPVIILCNALELFIMWY